MGSPQSRLICVAVVVLVASTASALSISNTLTVGDGLIAAGDWDSDDVTFEYTVWGPGDPANANPGRWTYEYILTVLEPAVSNFELAVSLGLDGEDVSFNAPGNPDEIGEIHKTSGTPGLAEDLEWGFKWDTSGEPLVFIVNLDSTRQPMWGDFGAKGGQSWVRNAGFVSPDWDPDPQWPDTADSNDHILVPDTEGYAGEIPEPLTLMGVLAGCGGLARYMRRRLA